MVTLLRAAELRELETRYAVVRPPLMERAGKAAAELAIRLLGKRRGRVLVCAGPGNNGGDARVMARLLAQQGIALVIVAPGEAIPGGDYGLVVDGLFGIGLARPVTGPYAGLVARINAFAGPVLALDVPSGIDGDTGRVLGTAVRATHTLSFIGGKPGLYTLDGPDHCGESQRSLDLDLSLDGFPGALLVARRIFAPASSRAERNSHKGSYGSLAVIGGAVRHDRRRTARRARRAASLAPGAFLPDCCSHWRSIQFNPS
jgi:NAD(P)H-hydrate repair Nnr-like enzyme with NAD(P)H-hydrate epimerase domain